MYFASLDFLHQRPCISKSAYHRCPHGNIINLKFCFLHAVVCIEAFRSHCLKCISRCILTFKEKICTAERRFHYTASRSKDHTGSCSLLHWTITFSIFQCLWTNMRCSNHFHKFSCRKYHINIFTCIFSVEQLHLLLSFFCQTRHDRDCENLLRTYAQFLRKIRLHNCTKHLLR